LVVVLLAGRSNNQDRSNTRNQSYLKKRMKLQDKVAIVSGAGCGTGKAFAIEFAKKSTKGGVRRLHTKEQCLKKSKGEIGRLKELWKDTSNIENSDHCVDIETYGMNQRGKTLVPCNSTPILLSNEKKIQPSENRLTK